MLKKRARTTMRAADPRAEGTSFVVQIIRRMSEAVCSVLQRWSSREFERRFLCSLNDKQLRDMRLTRAQVMEEAAKPFWKQ